MEDAGLRDPINRAACFHSMVLRSPHRSSILYPNASLTSAG